MMESLDKARDELKRADHLLYVGLKYTRTVDVIKSAIERLIAALGFMIDALLLYAKEKKKIAELPENPKQKCDALWKIFKDESELSGTLSFYLLLRRISRAEFTRAREYRRHVTMTVVIDEKITEVNIDILKEYYEKTRKFLSYSHALVKGEKYERAE